ncbi:MAG: AI-2E family transporter [Anaerosomatales bacterium]
MNDLRGLAPHWLWKAGVRGWLLGGVLVTVAAIGWFVGFTSGLIVPLIVAVILGVLFVPVVDLLKARGVPRQVGAVAVMIFVVALAVVAVWLTVAGVIDQGDEIVRQTRGGIEAAGAWLETLDLDAAVLDRVYEEGEKALPRLASGAATFFTGGLSGFASFIFGAFLGFFMLYYILVDWRNLSAWFGAHLGVPADLGEGIVLDSTAAVRQYFKGLTISAIVVAVLIGFAMWALGLPLAATIAVVTFITAYIPFLGAIVSGAFAFVVALGAGGAAKAFIVLAVVLITQNVIQTIVQNHYASQELELHPLATLIGTILGGTFGGLIGAMLGAPVMAVVVRTAARVRAYAGGAAVPPEVPGEAGA